jgi:LmbE family N-acetylglucosaminyl deacetylase
MNVLIVAAHPDDEILGCGGTIARLAQEGQNVYIAVLGEGTTSRYQRREYADPQVVEAISVQCRQAAELLGAKELFMYDLPDNRFDTVPLLDVVKIIEELVKRLEPKVIFTHHGCDLNIDHVITHRAVLTATRPVAGCSVKEIYSFEVPSSTDWAFGQFQPPFLPNVFMDITTTLEAKIRAMAVYEREARSFPHPRSPESLQAIARRWGSMVGLQAAESFSMVRSIR